MTQKAVMIGLLVGLLGSAGVIWAKLPPREAMQSTHFKDTQNTKTAEVQPPEPKEVMPPDVDTHTPADIRPRLVKLPRARPVGAKRCHCHKRLRKLLVLQTQPHGVNP